jgi:hypothetical protein
LRRLVRGGVAGAVIVTGERERMESAGVEDRVLTELVEKSVTVAVSLLAWRVWVRVLEPADEGRDVEVRADEGTGASSW